MLRAYAIANISMESVAFIMLIIILGSSIERKNSKIINLQLIYWIINVTSLLGCQLVMQLTNSPGISMSDTPVLFLANRFFIVVDCFLYFLLGPSFYHYVYSLLREKREFNSKQIRFFRIGSIGLGVWAVVVTVLYVSSLWTGWFYQIDANGFVHYTFAYGIYIIISLLGYAIIPVVIFNNRKYFGMKKTILLFSYLEIPLLFLPIDYYNNLCVSYIIYTFMTMLIYIEVDIKQSKELALQEARVAKREMELTNMRVNLMMAQIQPHFLYNALSSISYLCTKDPKEAEAATNEFASYLKANLRSINSQRPIPFEMELQHVENYLKIQKRRFLDRVYVEYNIETRNFRIPALALQTIVENSMKHGVETRFEPTTIWVSTRETETSYVVTVQDNGSGFDVNSPPKQGRLHLGIENTKKRLHEMVNGTLSIVSEPGKGTTVTMTIPKKTEVWDK